MQMYVSSASVHTSHNCNNSSAHPKVKQDGRLLLHLLQHTLCLVWVQRSGRHHAQECGRRVGRQHTLADLCDKVLIGLHLSHVALCRGLVLRQAELPAGKRAVSARCMQVT